MIAGMYVAEGNVVRWKVIDAKHVEVEVQDSLSGMELALELDIHEFSASLHLAVAGDEGPLAEKLHTLAEKVEAEMERWLREEHGLEDTELESAVHNLRWWP